MAGNVNNAQPIQKDYQLVSYLGRANPVSYTHLDVYKRQQQIY